MRIGLCYDVADDWAADCLDSEHRAEFDKIETIQAIEAVLTARGHAVERIGRARRLMRRLAEGARWDLVFNICEGLRGIGRESLVPALLDEYQVPYVFSDPAVLALSLHKAHCKRVIRDAGVATAEFRVIDNPYQVCDLPFPVFVKPIAEGTGKGIGRHSVCRTRGEFESTVRRVIGHFRQQSIAEALLPGREFTAGIIGTGETAEVVGVMEIRSEEIYGYKMKSDFERVIYRRAPELEAVAVGAANTVYRLVSDREARAAGEAALLAWRVLGGRDAGRIDLRSDASGAPMFLEVNPLAGLHPTDSDLTILARLAGHDHEWLLTRIMDAACDRLGLTW